MTDEIKDDSKDSKVKPLSNINYLETKPEKKVEFNHVNYSKMVSQQVKDKKQPWENLADTKKSKKPLIVPNKEVMEDRKKNPNGHKGRIK